MTIEQKIFQFANGIKVFERDISQGQQERYSCLEHAYHEPVEEYWFEIIFEKIQNRLNSKDVPIFVDVGSALGYYSLLFKQKFPQALIYAVDPHPHFQERMRKTFLLNGFTDQAYELIPYAVYPHSDTVVFAMRDYGSYVSQGEGLSEERTEDTIIVPARKLTKLLSPLPHSIDLIKLDIQAAELAVFNNNIELVDSQRVKHWIIGTHGPKIHDTILSRLGRRYDILYENRSPEHQEDGLIVAQTK